MRKVAIAVSVAAATVLVFAGCTSGPPGASEDGSLTLAVSADPGALDPSMSATSATNAMAWLAYDSLVVRGDDGDFLPSLAESWEIRPDAVDFTLRDDVLCADGSTLTAETVAQNFSFIADPENGSPLLGVFLPVGATAEAQDERTVTVSAPAPDPFLINGIALIHIVCQSGLDDRETLSRGTDGTGLWRLTDAVAEDRYVFERNPDYAWPIGGGEFDGEGVPESLEVRVVPNPTTLTSLLLSGEVNVASVKGADAGRLSDLPSVGKREAVGETFFNQTTGGALSEQAVRQALILAVDGEALGQVATGGEASPSRGLVTEEPPVCAVEDTVSGVLPEYDPDRAAQMLDEAGWELGIDGVREKDGVRLSIDFVYPNEGGDSMTAGAEMLREQWQALGADTEITGLSVSQLTDAVFATGDWDVAWLSIGVMAPSQLVPFFSGPAAAEGGVNFSGIANAEYEAAVADASSETDADAACEAWIEGEQALLRNADVFPMFDQIVNLYFNGVMADTVGDLVIGSTLRWDE